MTQEANLVKWLMTNGLEPDRTKMIGSLWSPPNWLKIPTGQQISWTNWDGTAHNDYGPFLPYGQYGGNTGGGRVDPNKWSDWARFVLSDVKAWQQQTGLPMYAFSFQNEPDVETFYNSASFENIAKDPSDLTKGTNGGQWQLYADGLQAISTELASHPEITAKFYGPEMSELGPSASNPWFNFEYDQVRQQLVNRGLLGALGGYALHGYQSASDGDAALWDAFYNGSAHAASILSNGSSNVLGWLYPVAGVAGDKKEIWQTEAGGEPNTWTKDGALALGLKINDALVYGNVSGYTVWELASNSASDTFGLVNYGDLNNPTNSFKFDAIKQFSRWIRPGAQRIKAVFDNGKASIGGANELDTYNALDVSAFNHPQDHRLTIVLTNMQTSSQSTTINIPASAKVTSFQVYQTTGTQKYVQLADLTPVNGKITLTVPASGIVTITGVSDLTAPTLSSGSFNYKTGQSVSFTFSEDVLASLKAGDFVVTNTTTNTIVPSSEFTFGATGGTGLQSVATLTHNASAGILPDGKYAVAISNVADVVGNPMTPTNWSFFVLTGDANHDGFVNAQDFTALAQNFNGSSATYDKGDFNYDGKVNALDFNALASRFGATSAAMALSAPLEASALSVAQPAANLFSTDSIGNDSANGLLDGVSPADKQAISLPERDWL